MFAPNICLSWPFMPFHAREFVLVNIIAIVRTITQQQSGKRSIDCGWQGGQLHDDFCIFAFWKI